VLACLGCNGAKRGQTLEEYRSSHGISWACDFEVAAKNYREFRDAGEALCIGLDVALMDLTAYCRRANFLFYGERMLLGRVDDYQI
jgi:hypothetical protein